MQHLCFVQDLPYGHELPFLYQLLRVKSNTELHTHTHTHRNTQLVLLLHLKQIHEPMKSTMRNKVKDNSHYLVSMDEHKGNMLCFEFIWLFI